MISLDQMKFILDEQHKNLPEFGMARMATMPIQKNFATIVTGVRRCGKSTLLLQNAHAKGPFHFIRFEDTRLADITVADFETLEQACHESQPKCKTYLLDEVQSAPSWELFVRSLLDKGNTVFVTGSNATLLSKELGTKLTGRHLDYTLYPFSYEEFKRFTDTSDVEEYLRQGGFPEYLKSRNEQILHLLMDDALHRDIVARHGLRDAALLKQIVSYLFSTIGSKMTLQKMAKTMHANSLTTLSTYTGYLADAYLFFFVPKYDRFTRKRIVNPKKVYSIDTALARIFGMSENTGHLLENAVYLQLQRRGYEIYYHQAENECDFVGIKGKERIAVQVCAHLHENKEREIEGLLSAMKALKLSHGEIVTLGQKDVVRSDGYEIRIVPAATWLME